MIQNNDTAESAEIPKPRSAEELHQAAVELMEKKQQEMIGDPSNGICPLDGKPRKHPYRCRL